VQCTYCGRDVYHPFKCHYCGNLYCGEHRVPESHRCVISRQVMNVPGAPPRRTERWPRAHWSRSEARPPPRPSESYGGRRRWKFRSGYHKWLRIRKSYVFLAIWVAGFALGLYLVPGLNFITLIGITLFNTIVVSIFVFGITSIRHRGVVHKVFGILLLMVLAGFLYQNPAVLTNISGNSVAGLYSSEGSYVATISSAFQSAGSSNSGTNTNTGSNPIGNIISAIQGPTINAQWVSQFIADLNTYRSVPLTESSTLDTFAKERFNTLVANYQISHYGYAEAFDSFFASQAISGTEEYFYPNESPSDYVTYIQDSAPTHWQGLIDSTYTQYGYYLGTGPVYEIYQPCPVSEIVGSVNETQLLQQNGCSFTIGTATYFVIELTS